ncbi:hypothetical protein AVEN_237057-1 [Araneus ventricosus]|uniref:Uncharacterized protein n=1 Tax=Araneus ventricosus TaxID=182803 RepID=A0A4Y2LZK5_ARAVE|nr:hypothetical protein AVEN_237057-1 [Araneus ventricosus]
MPDVGVGHTSHGECLTLNIKNTFGTWSVVVAIFQEDGQLVRSRCRQILNEGILKLTNKQCEKMVRVPLTFRSDSDQMQKRYWNFHHGWRSKISSVEGLLLLPIL